MKQLENGSLDMNTAESKLLLNHLFVGGARPFDPEKIPRKTDVLLGNSCNAVYRVPVSAIIGHDPNYAYDVAIKEEEKLQKRRCIAVMDLCISYANNFLECQQKHKYSVPYNIFKEYIRQFPSSAVAGIRSFSSPEVRTIQRMILSIKLFDLNSTLLGKGSKGWIIESLSWDAKRTVATAMNVVKHFNDTFDGVSGPLKSKMTNENDSFTTILDTLIYVTALPCDFEVARAYLEQPCVNLLTPLTPQQLNFSLSEWLNHIVLMLEKEPIRDLFNREIISVRCTHSIRHTLIEFGKASIQRGDHTNRLHIRIDDRKLGYLCFDILNCENDEPNYSFFTQSMDLIEKARIDVPTDVTNDESKVITGLAAYIMSSPLLSNCEQAIVATRIDNHNVVRVVDIFKEPGVSDETVFNIANLRIVDLSEENFGDEMVDIGASDEEYTMDAGSSLRLNDRTSNDDDMAAIVDPTIQLGMETLSVDMDISKDDIDRAWAYATSSIAMPSL